VKPDPNIGTEDELEEQFIPVQKASGDLYTFAEVKDQPINHVWTVVDDGGETESWYAEPGFHIVNVMGYLVTLNPWTDEGKTYYWYFDDRDRYAITLSSGDVEYEFADDQADAEERAEQYEEPGITVTKVELDSE